MIEPITEGDRVRGEIAVVLFREHITYIRSAKLWPAAFEDKAAANKRTNDSNIPDEFLPPSGSESDGEDDSEEGSDEISEDGAASNENHSAEDRKAENDNAASGNT